VLSRFHDFEAFLAPRGYHKLINNGRDPVMYVAKDQT
jgi:hypothetical protein